MGPGPIPVRVRALAGAPFAPDPMKPQDVVSGMVRRFRGDRYWTSAEVECSVDAELLAELQGDICGFDAPDDRGAARPRPAFKVDVLDEHAAAAIKEQEYARLDAAACELERQAKAARDLANTAKESAAEAHRSFKVAPPAPPGPAPTPYQDALAAAAPGTTYSDAVKPAPKKKN